MSIFFAQADILREKTPYFGKHLLAKQELITRARLGVQDLRLVRIPLSVSTITKSFAFFLGKVILFPVFAQPDINTRGVGRILDSYANPLLRLGFT